MDMASHCPEGLTRFSEEILLVKYLVPTERRAMRILDTYI